MSGQSTSSSARIPYRSRLAVRFTLPLLAILAFFSGTMLILGYFHVREQAVAGTAAQIRQLAVFASFQEAYVRRWTEGGAAPVVRALEEAGPDRLYEYDTYRQRLEDAILAAMPAERGMLGITVYLEDTQGRRHAVRFRRGEEPLHFTPGEDAMRRAFLAVANNDGSWRTFVSESGVGKELTTRYYTPVNKRDFQGLPSRFGVLTVDVSMAWVAGRIRTISLTPETQVFFMDNEGAWTLPEAPGDGLASDLARLHRLMFAKQTGQTIVSREGKKYVVAYMPLGSGDLMFGMFIPEKDLFGDLDRTLLFFVMVGLFLFLFALLFLKRTANLILHPVHELSLEAKRLSVGDFSPAKAPPVSRSFSRPLAEQWPDEPTRLYNTATRLRVALGQRQKDLTLLAATRERLFGEIALAGKLQHTLRHGTQKVPDRFILAAELSPAGHIAHEAFDYFSREEGTGETLYCVTASVTAHGIPAALLMDRVLPLLHELLVSGMSPAEALENANTIILSYAPIDKKGLSPFVSVFVGALFAQDGTILWASAGKPPPYRIFIGSTASLPWSGDFPLGVQGESVYTNHTTTLRPGETLLLCGGRLTALLSPDGEAFGEERLLSLLTAATGTPAQLIESIRSACFAHVGSETPPEDIALVAVRWKGRYRASPGSDPEGYGGRQPPGGRQGGMQDGRRS